MASEGGNGPPPPRRPRPVLEFVFGVAVGSSAPMFALGLVVSAIEAAEDPSVALFAVIYVMVITTLLVLPIAAVLAVAFAPVHLLTRRLGPVRGLILVGTGAVLGAVVAPRFATLLRHEDDYAPVLGLALGMLAGAGFWLGTAVMRRRRHVPGNER